MASNSVEMVFWDVQHGHATYIKTPNGKHIVVDLGIGDYDTRNQNFSPLLQLKNHWGVKQLDRLIISHPHLDHIDDILNVGGLYPKVVLLPAHLTRNEIMAGARAVDRPKFSMYCDIADTYSNPITSDSPEYVGNIDNWGGLRMNHFVPTTCNHNNFNNHSIVSVFEYAGMKVVIPGDNETPSFEELFKQPGFIERISNADILLAPHHGRESGYNAEFVSLVNPRLTIVSDGRFCDTSANDRYSRKSRGWGIYKNNVEVQRKCLTTNSDKEIYVNFGFNDSGEGRFLNVRIK
ncbi:ComEC/Rec2 family competence protein [Fibrella forsythiae]|uniref:MBL fold metallo-hydrolase n=1 Tax=Fibrella forsythiae TaxID=2817061 RepID=A0ABS3JNT2_9BACT|nr:MBL fold metallo-hydrolase [Fibrella forsythiae]MBO0950582.1 MBL fold metallo-hydrolase [Fibrella forsythiae]